jgi:hypothetical protein
MLTEIGRERGPDLQLKISDTLLTFQAQASNTKDIITPSSSITEVLNVISYLVSDGTRNFGSLVDTTNSVSPTVGGVVNTTGYYDAQASDVTPANAQGQAGAQAASHDPFLNNLAQQPAATTPFISLDTFTVSAAATEAFIPVNILRRTGVSDQDGINKVIQPPQGAADFRKLTGGGANAVPLLSDCVKQMITILKKTREIFGPKGWTDLFQKVKGGASSKKRTHRRHRRRYSSKQY